MYHTYAIKPGVFAIEEGKVRMFLICGTDRALLLDTGFGSGDLRSAIADYWQKDLIIAHTHAHIDHIGDDDQFDTVYANINEWPAIKEHFANPPGLRELGEGDVFDLGGRFIDVILTSGHTEGSLSFLDRNNRIIFSGDNISDRPVFLNLPGADLEKYSRSLRRLISLKPDFDSILACHGNAEQSFERARALLKLTEKIRSNDKDIESTIATIYSGDSVVQMSYGGVSVYLPLKDCR